MKKISELLIGTNNAGKYKEIKALLPKYIKTHSTSDFLLLNLNIFQKKLN